MRRVVSSVLAVGLLTVASACGDGGSVDTATPADAAPSWDPEDGELTLDELEQMFTALEEYVGADRADLKVVALSFSPSGIVNADALDPNAPRELNQYTVNIYTDDNRSSPYDYGGEEKYDALLRETFPADVVDEKTLLTVWEDSFERVKGKKGELDASGPDVRRGVGDTAIKIGIVNGPERDRQNVYYDTDGTFLEVS